MQSSHVRGWPVAWNGREWVYADTGKLIDDERPCRRCGRKPTPEGYDACLGYVPGIASACCGHGVEEPYSVRKQHNRQGRRNTMGTHEHHISLGIAYHPACPVCNPHPAQAASGRREKYGRQTEAVNAKRRRIRERKRVICGVV